MTPQEQLEATLNKINDAVIAQGGEVKSLIDKRDAEVKALGAATEATGKKLDQQGEVLIQIKADFDGKLAELATKLAEEKARGDELEKKSQRPGWAGVEPEIEESLGEQFAKLVGGDNDFKQAALNQRKLPGIGLTVKSFHAAGREKKAVLGSAAISGFVQPLRLPDIQGAQERMLRIRDLMQVIPTDRSSIEFVEEIGFYPETAATFAITSVTSVTTTATVTTTSTIAALGLKTGDTVKIAGAVETEYNGNYRITVTGASTFTYIFAGGTSPATGTITGKILQQHGAAAGVTEGSAKPETAMEFILRTYPVQTIAHWLPAARQIVDDLPQLRNLINNRLLYGLKRAEERQILYGTGTSPQLQGIMTHPNVSTYSGATPDTKLDAIRRAYTVAARFDYEPDGLVISHLDFEDLELIKGTDMHYVWGTPTNGAGNRIWRMDVVATNAMDETDFLVGNFQGAAALFDREQANIRFSESHSDYFTKNQLAILAEERVAAVWFRPQAFVAGDFGTATDGE